METNSTQIESLTKENKALTHKLGEANKALQPRTSDSKQIQVNLDDRSKKVKFMEDDSKIQGYENKIKDQE